MFNKWNLLPAAVPTVLKSCGKINIHLFNILLSNLRRLPALVLCSFSLVRPIVPS